MTHEQGHIIVESLKERMTKPIVGKASAFHLLLLGALVGGVVGALVF